MNFNSILLQACPSIQYRIRKEILNESIHSPAMQDLQKQILNDSLVREVISWQQPDGWINKDFHGENSLEAGIRILSEKGVDNNHPALKKALRILTKNDERLSLGIGKVGKILDDYNLGGTEMIRAVVFAYARNEENPIVHFQIPQAIAAFKSAASIQSIDEISNSYKGKLVFKPHIVLPSIYHLRLLAFTTSWRTKENLEILKNAIQNLVNLSPIPHLLVKHKSQLIAPASFCMLDFNPDMRKLKDADWMMWFHRLELLARAGIVQKIPELLDQVSYLKELLNQNDGKFSKKLSHPYFRKWNAYSGLMLEQDWYTAKRRVSDLTFRSLLILHHSKHL